MMLDKDSESIIALCTPQGQGALALIRLVGKNIFSQASSWIKLASQKNIQEVSTHTIHYGKIITDDAAVIDHSMFIVMHAPHTFTGQNTLEITCHNNQFLIQKIFAQALKSGIRLADHGEFSRRAFLYGKLDLLQVEAINELIQASSEYALKQALAQLEGSFSSQIVAIEKNLMKALALSESSFEFLDEEGIEFSDQIKQLLIDIASHIAKIKHVFDQQKQIRQGIRIALIGNVNVGKSSLFNQLVGMQRAIVNAQAGTTRDVIEYGMYQDGIYVTYIDTAGLRSTEQEIEKEGIEKSYQELHQADIILLVVDLSRKHTKQEQTLYQHIYDRYSEKILVVGNKKDHKITDTSLDLLYSIEISALHNENIASLKSLIQEKIYTLLHQHATAPFLLNKRQFNIILDFEQKLQSIIAMLHQKIHYELLSYHLQDCLQILTQLTGKNISDQAMDQIFKEFCIGK